MDLHLPLLARGLFALPPRAQAVLGGRVPAAAAGLEPDAWLVARLAERDRDVLADLPLDVLRRKFERTVATVSVRPRVPVARADASVAGAVGPLAARLYTPAAAAAPGPLLVYYHGGGWVEGSAATHEPACVLLAHLAGVRVLSVDYRLAPEHPFPAAADDALAASATSRGAPRTSAPTRRASRSAATAPGATSRPSRRSRCAPTRPRPRSSC